MELFSVLARIGLDTSDFERGLSDVEQESMSFGKKINNVLDGIFSPLDAFRENILELNEVSDTVDDISEAFGEAETSVNGLAGAFNVFISAVRDALNTILDFIRTPFESALDGIAEKVRGLIDRIREGGKFQNCSL